MSFSLVLRCRNTLNWPSVFLVLTLVCLSHSLGQNVLWVETMYLSQWNDDLFLWWIIWLSLCPFFWLSLISATRQRGVIQLGRDRLSPGGKTGTHSTGGAGDNVPVRIWDGKVTNYQTGRPIYVFEPMKWWSFFMMDDSLRFLCALFSGFRSFLLPNREV
jgi:hypothetical protein